MAHCFAAAEHSPKDYRSIAPVMTPGHEEGKKWRTSGASSRKVSAQPRAQQPREENDRMSFVSLLALVLPLIYMSRSEIGAHFFSRGAAARNARRMHQGKRVYRSEPLNHIQVHQSEGTALVSSLTLRRILGGNGSTNDVSGGGISSSSEVHLAMAPAFFGFYGYFGALQSWEDAGLLHNGIIRSYAGASAGAIAAILLAAGIPPSAAAEFCQKNVSLTAFADGPGALALFLGDEFEKLMFRFLHENVPMTHNLRLDDPQNVAVAVTAYDLQTQSTKILTRGSMARAARASATFPGLFHPVVWGRQYEYPRHHAMMEKGDESISSDGPFDDYLLVDGGLQDTAGLLGLTRTILNGERSSPSGTRTIINLVVGNFDMLHPHKLPTLPGKLMQRVDQAVFVALHGLPQPGPWAMANGLRATNAARKAMTASLDADLEQVIVHQQADGPEQYVLHIDASKFA